MNPRSSQEKQTTAHPSARKLAALRQLGTLPVKLSDGSDYQLQEAIQPGVTLAEVREALKRVPGSLADLILEERQQR